MYLVFKIDTKYLEKFVIHKEENNSVKERERERDTVGNSNIPLSVTDRKSKTKNISKESGDVSNTIHKLNGIYRTRWEIHSLFENMWNIDYERPVARP